MMPDVDLPVRAALPELLTALDGSGTAVLVAPPGSGKTTLVPLALADQVKGRVIVAEPRRIAARAAASRMAHLTGTQVGGLVGYTVRGDSRTGGDTRVEVVTTGVLVQRLHRDPELTGVAAVVLDECHERHLDTDLALAFTLDSRTHLRPDLRLLATSATADAERLAAAMGARTSIVSAAGMMHPVEVVWAPPTGPVDAPYGLRVDPRLLDHVAAVVRRALAESPGDALVFLPGAAEIGGVAQRLGRLSGVDVVSLHGRQAASVQDEALRPGVRRRVVLATAVAESSLTVPGVRIVVDSGLARVPRTDHGRGLGALVTVRASRAAATQRAGRAGREAPGSVYRCWSEHDHERLPAQADPEIAGADLTGFVLHLACWGRADAEGLTLLDPPPAAAAQVARETLTAIGALDQAGRVTPRGRDINDVGAHPRLARALLDGSKIVGSKIAAEVVALLSADVRTATDDLPAALRRLQGNAEPAVTSAWRTEVRRLAGGIDANRPTSSWSSDLAAALLVGLAFPERIGRVRTPGGRVYLMTGGTAAELAADTSLHGMEWLAIADADRQPGNAAARIRLAAPIDAETAKLAAETLYADRGEVTWTNKDVLARHRTRLGAIVLTDRPLAKPDPEAVAAALGEGLRRNGLKLLRWSDEATGVRERLAFLRHALGEPWPAVDDAGLLADLSWLGPALVNARNRADLARIDVASALRRLLPWAQAAQFDEYAPDRIEVPSGSRIRVDYTDPAAPFLAVKVQEMFGSAQAPTLAGGRVPLVLHLLSPAGRPAAVTADLASFWDNGYVSVRSELRGRYPNHPWPDNPLKAKPSGRTKPRK
ncbi:MAG: ATP-dependent helicase HrpB [Hamadaea sp.]|uniref:ATP-dependent helicase HrpB n=1 Tax=Hamadaea sp. TaxID=2024425 RepID=UPI001815CB06|nr:ATP-dependent helicase HrpB [Hamadaea sp.]NUT20952.1 ATP-dependent helicase HrpB [Hamadaea sp.]